MNHEVRLERFELKYIIPSSLVQPIINYIQVYCDKDPYSLKHADGFYQVNSLYLDSEAFQLLENKRQKVYSRFNLRVRSYGDGSKPPYFFEMKCKKGDIVDKLRCKVVDENWSRFFNYKQDFTNLHTANADDLNVFFRRATNLNAEPKILTRYQRLAYFSTIDDYARVTFDRNLQFQPVSEFTVTPNEEKMCNYDVGSAFDGRSSVVLELKSHRNLPIWMMDLIRFFGLHRQSFSKYEKSLEESFFADFSELHTTVPALIS